MTNSSGASEAAERYAQAVFELAQETNALDVTARDFELWSRAFTESADLRQAASSPLIDAEEKSRALVAVAERLGVSAMGRNVAGVVARNGRAAELPQVAQAYAKLLARKRGIERAEIVAAQPLSDVDLKSILDGLAELLGRKVEADVSVDPGLIGGFVVRVGSRQFDASLKTKLASLKLALKQAS